MKKHVKLFIALMILLAFVVSGCGSSQPAAPAPQKSAAVEVDKGAATKEAIWSAYAKVVAENNAKTFPLPPDKAKEAYVGNESKYLLIDLRAAEDYTKGHLKGAVNIPLSTLPQQIDKLPKDKTLMLYCYSGQQSSLPLTVMKGYGYKAVSISKGFPEAQKAGFPVDTTPVAFTPAVPVSTSDPKDKAAFEGMKDALTPIINQQSGKTLIVSADTVKGLLAGGADKYVIVDLRAAADYDKEHVKGAVNIPLANLKEKLGTLPKDKTLVLYCYSGQTAAMATVPLKAEGYKLMSLNAGFGNEAAKMPLEKK